METEKINIEDSIFQELSEEIQDLESEVKLPYVLRDKILMSPGVWNSYYYSADSIEDAFNTTDWEAKENRSLFLDHVDDRSSEWIGDVKNVRINGDDLIGDLWVLDKPTAMKLHYGAKMGISPKVHGPAEGNVMQRFVFDNFSVVINPAVKTAWINNSQKVDLDELNEFIDIYKSFIEAEEVIEKMSAYTDFVKKYIKAHPDLSVQEAMKRAGKEWKKKKGGKKMSEEEQVQEEEQKEELAKKKKYPYPDKKKMEEESEESEESNELSDIKIMLEHLMSEIQELKKKEYPYPYKKKMDEEVDEEAEEEMARKKKKPEEEEMVKKKKPEEEEKMAKKKKPEEEEEKKMDEEKEAEENDVVEEMSERIEKLQSDLEAVTKKLNEPDKVTVKQELSSSDIDADMLGFLQTLG